jgi:hypothetical protein
MKPHSRRRRIAGAIDLITLGRMWKVLQVAPSVAARRDWSLWACRVDGAFVRPRDAWLAERRADTIPGVRITEPAEPELKGWLRIDVPQP